jgi:hypothetical protein
MCRDSIGAVDLRPIRLLEAANESAFEGLCTAQTLQTLDAKNVLANSCSASNVPPHSSLFLLRNDVMVRIERRRYVGGVRVEAEGQIHQRGLFSILVAHF